MVFSSVPFLFYFFPAVMIGYFLCPRRMRNGLLFVVSLVFYAWGEPVYVVLMLFSALVDYSHGLLLERLDQRPTARRWVLASSCIINLGLLGFFKYTDFLIGSLNAALGLSLPLINLPLPIGISFYTFQTMSYTIDVYWRKCPAQHNFISFGCYVAMFPQLIAGPIVRYITVAQELDNRRETREGVVRGMMDFTLGLAKKVLLANNIGALWELVKAQPIASLPALTAWLGMLAFAFQIFFDFAGYSQMAIGLGRMFGFTFPENFRYPYIATSVTDFWRRWHITLSTWFREYLYIPLGGNRCGRAKQIRNLMIVWAATGIWHGASWNFLVWGLYFGVILILEKFLLGPLLERLPRWVSWGYTMLAVVIGWCFFSFDALGDGALYLTRLVGLGGGADRFSLYALTSYWPLLLLLALCSTPLPARLCAWLKARLPRLYPWLALAACLAGLLICLGYVVDSSYNPFLYFRF